MWKQVRSAANRFFRAAAYMAGMSKNLRLTDIPADFADLIDSYPQVPDFAWPIMFGYAPKKAHAPGAWTATRAFTLATAAAMLPDTYDVTRRLMTMTAHFHMWLWARTGTELTIHAVYTQNNIDRYLEATLSKHSKSHRWGVSRQLVKIGRELADADLMTLPAPDGKRRPPFTDRQIASMHSWANSLTTVIKKQNAWALLGLAAGAGLTAAEIVRTRVTDIERDGDTVFVNVRGAKARRVPVRHAYGRVLRRSIEGREQSDERLFRGPWIKEYPPRIIQTFLTEHRARVRPTPSTLRTGWILHHINNNVPPLALMEAAGIDNFQTLGRFYEHATPQSLSDLSGLFVGAEVAR